jgi:sugar O-acyltransferase (sialic acid O-acetyltransferase NeuD family)|tara:strand:- start:3176 stop:3850 length:675 start_codon:yes stop_codon:yes gene_type:complete
LVTKKSPINVVIFGAQGHGKDVLSTIIDLNKNFKKYKILGFIDDDPTLQGSKVCTFSVLGNIDWFSKPRKNIFCIVAIGDSKTKFKIVKKLEKLNVPFFTVIHPSVICSKFVKIGIGSVIHAGCVITSDVEIGNHVDVNIGTTIAHECHIDDFVTIGPGSHLNGVTHVEKGSIIGSGTITKEDITIGQWSIVGAGTVVITDVPKNSIFLGVPGKLKKYLNNNKF